MQLPTGLSEPPDHGPTSEVALISLGSNIDAESRLPSAVRALRRLGEIEAVSMVYQNPAVGSTPQADYLNAAVRLRTHLEAHPIRERLREIEVELGRVRSPDRFAPRTIDLDLCLLGSTVIADESLMIPHPDLLRFAHVIIPVAELAPDLLHPTTGEPLRSIAARMQLPATMVERPDICRLLQAA